MTAPPEKPVLTISELFPRLAGADLEMAEDNLEQYLALVLRIFDRLEAESNPQVGRLTDATGTLPCTPSQEASSQNSHSQ